MWPDINGFLAMLYGGEGVDLSALTVWQFGRASGVVFSGNPPYTATDFLGFYPKFFGPPTVLTVSNVTIGQPTFDVTAATGLAVGQLLVSSAFPKDTVINSIAGNTITASANATAISTSVTVYKAPMMPLVMILWFVYMAGASVMQQRYQEAWPWAMALYIAHFSEMWMRSKSGDNSTAAKVVASGLERGMLVGKSAGDVSASIQFLDGFDEWGAFRETTYGIQFATMSMNTNAGPVWVR